jgi:hypothetical protein
VGVLLKKADSHTHPFRVPGLLPPRAPHTGGSPSGQGERVCVVWGGRCLHKCVPSSTALPAPPPPLPSQLVLRTASRVPPLTHMT